MFRLLQNWLGKDHYGYWLFPRLVIVTLLRLLLVMKMMILQMWSLPALTPL